MKESKNNPSSNKLNPGISESDIDKAIIKSGYPLQTIVADVLRKEFYVQEEWSFLDTKTKEIRAIDILAEKRLYEFDKEQPRVRPTLNLIIECKQSELPYTFFLSPENRFTQDYPLIAGLFQKDISVSTDDTPSTWSLSIKHALGFDEHEFFKTPPTCMTFSKCVRKGANITLSGTDGYQNLILPIISSMHDFSEAEKPPSTAMYFDGHLTFGIGVVDAPMIGVKVNSSGHEQELLPWVRVYRHESYEHEDHWKRKKLYAIDIIHKDFLHEFIEKHLLPFSREFAGKIIKHDKVISSGKGFASGMEKNPFKDLEQRLEPRKFGKSKMLPNLFPKKDEKE